jgi:DNA-binding IclR family transcriptional regulator
VSKRLAELEKTGACSDIGTYRPSIMAVSAPLRDRAGAVVAAVSMIGFREDFDDVSAKAKRRLVLEAAKHCGVLLQGRANADTPDQRRAQDNPRRNN